MAYAQPTNMYEGPPPAYPSAPMNQNPYSVPMSPPSSSMYAPPPPPTGPMYTPLPPPIPTVVTQPTSIFLGHNPQPMQCPLCSQQIVTQVRYDAGAFTWLAAFLICFFGGIFGCCLIPFCVPQCQDVTHTCPACRATLGRRSSL